MKVSGVLVGAPRLYDRSSVDVLVTALKRAREFIAQDTSSPRESVALELRNIDEALASLDPPSTSIQINLPGGAL
ncbi:hypothetical protein GCM10025794_01320 [Massilia kyonggiensis]